MSEPTSAAGTPSTSESTSTTEAATPSVVKPKVAASKFAVVGRWVAGVVGLVMLLGGVGAVMFGNWNPPPEPPTELVRPVKVAMVVDAGAQGERRLPGQVLAGRTVDLSFQVGGPLVESDLKLGRELAEGDVVARIDPVRFEQQIAVLEPQIEQLRVKLERIEKLIAANAATPQELTDAKAAYQGAQAQLKIAQQSLADTVLKAPFRALVVQRFVENFQNIQPGTAVARLQDIATLDLSFDFPEAMVALYRKRAAAREGEVSAQPYVVFSVLPDKRFDVKVKEASAEADPATGMYRVIFTMPRPTELTALPGMAVTLVLPARQGEAQEKAIPVAAIWVSDAGNKQVWRVREQGGQYQVEATAVQVVRLAGEQAIIGEGVAAGDRVVTAGTSLLRQGQRIRLMEQRP